MNQRTTELYQQALEFAYNNVPREDWNSGVFHPIVSGKFAELIVRECAVVADRWVDDEDNGHNLVSDKLRQHFGVEE